MPEILDRLTRALADRYRIEGELGQGGMAMVYLAHDLKHDRAVALKVLRPELAAILGADRFLQEIKVTAKLQHPHILTLHDSGEAEGLLFYVMPFVEGESLRDRLARERQLSVDESLRIATQVASALDYAHRHNVIHRDIKPENILLEDGQAMVADFGIALAVRAAGGARLTETGLSLGTPHYMSPEQATGDRELDARSDIYSLGCVVYEMLAGESPHTGPSAQAVIAKVLTNEPRPLYELRRTVPAHVAAAVSQALEKLPADRFSTAAQFADALSGNTPIGHVNAGRATKGTRVTGPQWAVRTLVPWAVAAAAAAGFLWNAVATPRRTGRNVVRFEITTDLNTMFVTGAGRSLAISPDGNHVVFRGAERSGDAQLYARDFRQLEAQPISGTLGAAQPFFSPDGAWVGFVADGKLRKIALTGGPSSVIADVADLRGATWSGEGRIVYVPASGSGLVWVSASGGPAVALTTPDTAAGEVDHRWPHALPNGKTVLFTIWRGFVETAEIGAVSIETGVVERLGPGVSPQYADGFLFVATAGRVLEGPQATAGGILSATPFRPPHERTSGPTIPVLERFVVKRGGGSEYAVAANGTLVYHSAGHDDQYLALVDREGREQRLVEGGDFHPPRVSPDGRRVGMVMGTGTHDVWILEIGSRSLTRLTGTAADDYPTSRMLWTPDGERVVFQTAGSGAIVVRPSQGTGTTDTLARGAFGRPQAWLRAGKALVTERGRGPPWAEDIDLWSVEIGSVASPTPLVAGRTLEWQPDVSPDERWLAYASNETGRFEVYVADMGASKGHLQVSRQGGWQPVWSRDGRALFYRSVDAVVMVPITRGAELAFGEPVTLFRDSLTREWDALPDGEHFVMVRSQLTRATNRLFVVQNWLEEVREKLAKN